MIFQFYLSVKKYLHVYERLSTVYLPAVGAFALARAFVSHIRASANTRTQQLCVHFAVVKWIYDTAFYTKMPASHETYLRMEIVISVVW